MTQDNRNASGNTEAISIAYGVTFLVVSLVAVGGIAVNSVIKAMDAMDERRARKKRETRRQSTSGPIPQKPQPSPSGKTTKVVPIHE